MPNFTYTQNIPFASNSPSVDQPNMQVNTNSIASIVDVDLIGFGDNNGGYHQKSTYVVQGSDPSSASGQIVEYSKTVSGHSEVFLVRDAGTPFQLTRGSPVASGTGYTFLPGGILMQWGSVNFGSSQSVTFTFPTPFTSAVYTVWSNQTNLSSGGYVSISIGSIALNTVTLWRSTTSGPNTAFVTAIGV